jgi:hypothetical protein
MIELAEIARKYRDKYGMEMPTMTLAKIMYNENKLIFNSVEHARTRLRYIEGKSGKGHRKYVINSKFFKKDDRNKSPFNLPQPEGDDLIPYDLDWKDFIVAGDFHLPNHRITPIETMLTYAKENGIKRLLINGDLMDNTPFTRWISEPVKHGDVVHFFNMAEDFLIEMKRHFDEVIWLEGNHDFWYKRWLMTKADLLFHDNYFHLEQRLGLHKIGVKFLDQTHLVRTGKLYISHGHVMVKGGSATAAKRLLDKSGVSHLIGHLHIEQSHTKTNLDGSMYGAWVHGCMCTLTPEYQPFGGQACHGFAHVTVNADSGNFKLRNYRIDKNGEIM